MNPEDHPARKGYDHPYPNSYPIIILRRCFDGWKRIQDDLDSDGDIILEYLEERAAERGMTLERMLQEAK